MSVLLGINLIIMIDINPCRVVFIFLRPTKFIGLAVLKEFTQDKWFFV